MEGEFSYKDEKVKWKTDNDKLRIHLPCTDRMSHSIGWVHISVNPTYPLLSMEKVIKCTKCGLSVMLQHSKLRDT